MKKNLKIYPVVASVTFLHEDTIATIKSKLKAGGITNFNDKNVEAAACYTESITKDGRPITFQKFLEALIPLCNIKVTCEDWNVKFKIDYRPGTKDDKTEKEFTELSNKQMKYHFDGTNNKQYNLKIAQKDIPEAMPFRTVKYQFETIEEAYDVLKNFDKRKMEIAVRGQLVTLTELGIKAGAITLSQLPQASAEIPIIDAKLTDQDKTDLNNLI